MNDEKEYFGTQGEAVAFAKGMKLMAELADFDMWVGDPTMEPTGDWFVEYGYCG
jgi:hypothetical protein